MPLIHNKLKQIKAFVFDVDGVLSDGRVILHPDGDQIRTMSVKDGYALKKAMQHGYLVAIISGGNSPGVLKRLEYLGVPEIHLGIKTKITVFNEMLLRHNLKPEEVLYMGDDIPDIPVLLKAGVASCPANAVNEVKEVAQYISPKNGGEECVRDVIEQTLKLKKLWFSVQDFKKTT